MELSAAFFSDNNISVHHVHLCVIITKMLHSITYYMVSHLNKAFNPFLPQAVLYEKYVQKNIHFLQRRHEQNPSSVAHDLWAWGLTCGSVYVGMYNVRVT